MRIRLRIIFALLLSLTLLTSSDAFAGRRVKTHGKSQSKSSGKDGQKEGSKDSKLKSFSKMIKDKVAIEGLFTFYQDTTDNSMLMEIKPEQLGPIYLCGQTRSQAEGAFFDNGSMGRTFPFYLKRVGKRIFLMEKNLRFRADTSSTLHDALQRGVSDHLFGSTEIKSKPQDSTEAILIDPTSFFVRDIEHVGYYLGTKAKIGFSFDKKNSYFSQVKSFPNNTEIDVKLHFKTSRPVSAPTMQNPFSMFHTFHYSLSTLPETDYVPRLADDRIGHFLTMHQDYTTLDSESPYVRYIERWNLKKKNPDARVSEPLEPIVYWVENTVPKEFKDAVAEGIEFWNPAFEKLGFRNAIVAKNMPDTASWDPADVRYSVVRWIVNPGATYAVGPSRANPFTGQIYDADIRISVDFIRIMFTRAENMIKPIAFDGTMDIDEKEELPLAEMINNGYRFCNFAAESAEDAAFGLSYLTSGLGTMEDLDSLQREYITAYIVELVAHEVGHTLGFRHNFKASSIYTLDQINDRSFTKVHSTIGTVMDYAPVNLAGPGKTQGEFYASVPGPYDNWVVQYAYSDFGNLTTEEELPKLKKIADRASEPELVYGTDEDAFGYSMKSIDPHCNLFDLGSDPLAYGEHSIAITKELWTNAVKKFDIPGEQYQKIRRVFSQGWRNYYGAVRAATKFIGGLHHNRLHIGDKEGSLPFETVSAAQQRRAMKLLREKIFAADAFDFPPDLLNKLQPERFPDFQYSVYSVSQIDYPIHAYVLRVQRLAVSSLYSPYVLGRLQNNQLRYAEGAERYTMYDMFTDTRRAIWGEITGPSNVNSFRRQLQLVHLNRIVSIYLGSSAIYPIDARSLAADDLDILKNAIRKTVNSTAVNNITRTHFKEVLRQIDAATGARRNFLGARF